MSTPSADAATDGRPRTRDGRAFIVVCIAFLALFTIFLLVFSPQLQDGLGLNQPLPFPTPPTQTEVVLTGDQGLTGTAIWDGSGVCAEVVDRDGTTFRTCAVPDPLRPIWAIDAPDASSTPYLLVATPPDVVSIEGRTTAGETFSVLTEARELPAAWALVPLPEGAVVQEMRVFNASASDVGGAECGAEDAPTGGSDRLAGGCLIPSED